MKSWDVIVVVAGAVLVAAAYWVGSTVEPVPDSGVHVPPLSAKPIPHLGPGTVPAVAVAIALVAYGPMLAAKLRWRALLFASWSAAAMWTVALAFIDGWDRGIAKQLTTDNEYLSVISRFGDVGAAVRGFTDHILIDAPANWPAHIAGHPPGAVLTFVGLDRLGLSGGGWAATWCIVVGTSAVAAILVTARSLAGEDFARRAAAFVVLAPAAIWVGVSADGYFAAVGAWAVCLLVVAARSGKPTAWLPGLGAGLLFGLAVYLSYGLTLLAIVALAVLVITKTVKPLPWVIIGALVIPLIFTIAGFYWWEAYALLVERYDQGAGGVRSYPYWVWGNLAATILVIGPAALAGLRRVLATTPQLLGPQRTPIAPMAMLIVAFMAVIAVADLSGMSKAETERIWLPFTLWLLPAAALIPQRRRAWLAGSAILALAINHLVLTSWLKVLRLAETANTVTR